MVQLLVLGGAIIAGIIVISLVVKLVGLAIMIGTWMLAGHLAAKLVRGESYGLLGDTALGFAGGIIGSIVLSLVGLGSLGHAWLIGGVIAGVVGAVIIVYFIERKNDKAGEPSSNVKIKV